MRRPEPARVPAITLLLAVVVVVLAGVFAVAVARPGRDAPTTSSPVTTPSHAKLLRSAEALTVRAMSASYRSLARDVHAAAAGMTPGFAAQYLGARAGVRRVTLRDKIVTKAQVKAAGLISAHGSVARVLVFVDLLTTRAGSPHQRLDQDRVVVTVVRGARGWLLAGVNAF